MPSRHRKDKRVSAQAKRIRALEQKNKRLEKEARLLRAQVRRAVKDHKKVKVLRARLARANRVAHAIRAQKPKRFRKVKLAKPIEGGTRKLPKFRRQKRRVRTVKRKQSRYRIQLIPGTKNTVKRKQSRYRIQLIPGTKNIARIVAPVSYQDWHNKLKRLKNSKAMKTLQQDYPRITYSVYGHPGGIFYSMDQMLMHFDERYIKERMIAERYGNRILDDWFSHIIVYGLKNDYRGPKADEPNYKKEKYNKPNKTGRN